MMTRTSAPDHRVSTNTVIMLQSMTSYPSVSLLMPTTPGVLDAAQRSRLSALRDSVAQRLASEEASESKRSFSTKRVLLELDVLIDRADDVQLEKGLALYVNEHHSQLIVLPVDVSERAVVDPTFATRDLVRALHRTPRHVVVSLSAREARLFEGQLGSLRPAETSKFPMTTHGDDDRNENQRATFLRRVDQALGAYLRLRPSPVVVMGAEPTLSQFCQTSLNLDRLAGKVVGNHIKTPLSAITDLVAPHLETYLASRQHEALALLEQRRGQDRAVLGLDTVWLAARWERPEMLAVDVDFFYPARISHDGDNLEAADDVEHPDVIDDVVDELVEQVLARGAWVALIEPGRLPDGERIALTTRQH